MGNGRYNPTLGGGEWSVSRSDSFNQGTHWLGDWVSPTVCLNGQNVAARGGVPSAHRTHTSSRQKWATSLAKQMKDEVITDGDNKPEGRSN